MKAWTLLSLFVCGSLCAAQCDQVEKKSYEESKRQTKARQAADELLFLQPHLASNMTELAGKVVLDAGLGSARHLLMEGVQVCSLDSGEEESQELIPYKEGIFDHALSVNIGSSLPSTMHVVADDIYHVEGLGVHCQEIARVLKNGGEATIVAPGSYGVLFTNGACSEDEAMKHVQTVLASIEDVKNEDDVVAKLCDLQEVNRATFVEKEGRLALVTDESNLMMGQQIWRKEGEQVFSSYYHSVEEYLVALANAGLSCKEIKRPCFFGKVKYNMYHKQLCDQENSLGQTYIDHNPFTIYTVVKSEPR